MNISLIAAMARGRVIGQGNQLPWRLPADLKHFKALTMGKTIIMGRRTHESIGKALPGRQNIIVTHDVDYQAKACTIVHSIQQAFTAGESDELMVIGGATLYQQCLPFAQRMYLTFIDHEVNGDAFFPQWDPSHWCELERIDKQPDEQNPYHYSFVTLESCS